MIFNIQINPDDREEIIAKVHQRTALVDEIERLVRRENNTGTIPAYDDDEITLLDLDQVECFFSEADKTYAVCEGKQYLVKKRLNELESVLPNQFERISKSAIANWDRIKKFKVQLSGAVNAVFVSGYTDYISRRCFSELKRRYNL